MAWRTMLREHAAGVNGRRRSDSMSLAVRRPVGAATLTFEPAT